MTTSDHVYPGREVGRAANAKAGPGTMEYDGRIYSTLVGTVRTSQVDGRSLITVTSSKARSIDVELQSSSTSNNLLPKVGDIVLARINRISKQQANAQIIVIGETALHEDFQGVIRTTDVRAYDVDKVKIAHSFRPNDIVRAEVISLGDQSSYYLTTAKNELGVLFAWSELGEMLSPISWNQMAAEKGVVEERKVAKPFI